MIKTPPGRHAGAVFAAVLNQVGYTGGVVVLAAALVATFPSHSLATTDAWTGGSANTSNWNDAGNWSPGTPLNGDGLLFGSSNVRTTNSDNIASLSVTDITFSAAAAAFTTDVANGAALTLTGTGIVNNSSNIQTLINDEGVSGGLTTFNNSATAANLHVTNTGTTTGSGHVAGNTIFNDTSTADTATISDLGGTANGSVAGGTIFNGTSTAGTATIINTQGTVAGSSPGNVGSEVDSS